MTSCSLLTLHIATTDIGLFPLHKGGILTKVWALLEHAC